MNIKIRSISCQRCGKPVKTIIDIDDPRRPRRTCHVCSRYSSEFDGSMGVRDGFGNAAMRARNIHVPVKTFRPGDPQFAAIAATITPVGECRPWGTLNAPGEPATVYFRTREGRIGA